MKALYFFAAACTAAFSIAASAADPSSTDRPPRPPGGMGPPPEALAACQGKAAGSAVSITRADGKVITGTCQIMFRPDRPPAK